jgi:hypothetical protein
MDSSRMYDYESAEWPKDANLMRMLEKSGMFGCQCLEVAPGDRKRKPYKHRCF